jgi:hypothetical protein
MIRVQIFDGAAGVRALAPAWRSLTAQLQSKRHFHHVEWHLALAETLERHNLAPLRCAAVFSGDAMVAVFPFRFMRVQLGPLQVNALRLASDQIDAATARDFILAPGLAQTGFFQGFVKYMAEHHAWWDIMDLPGILEDSLAATALKHCSQLPILQTPGGAWGRVESISSGDDDQPLNRLTKGFRQNLRTAHNKLKAELVTFEIASAEHDLLRLLPEFLKVESSGWKGELGTSALKDPATGTFVRQLISHFAPIGGCEIRLMRIGDAAIATMFGIVTDNIWYIFRIGYDEAYHRASPGHLIIENLLKERRTNKSFRFVTPYNAPPWFGAWKPDSILQIFNAYLFRPSPDGLKLAKQAATIMHGANRQP